MNTGTDSTSPEPASVTQATEPAASPKPRAQVAVDCGWGRVIFAQTFANPMEVIDILTDERPGTRDIAIYAQDPHVVTASAPHLVFLDPSHTYRLWLRDYQADGRKPTGFHIRPLQKPEDAQALHELFKKWHMMPAPAEFIWNQRNSPVLNYLVAEEDGSGQIVGMVMGIDHVAAFGDPENGASLWALAVDPQTCQPGIGEALTRGLAEHFLAQGRTFMDLSVIHDNTQAIGLYEKLGFQRVPVFCLKHKNSYNEPLFAAPPPKDYSQLNPYAMVIVNEARWRGILVEVLDAQAGYFKLSCGGRSVICRESLTELTNAIAMSRCDDKRITSRLLAKAGLRIPAQIEAGDEAQNLAFLSRHAAVVVKPARGEQGQGISVDIRDEHALKLAITTARRYCETVLIEEMVSGLDLRIIVIGFEMAAAAIRKPAEVIGNGRHDIRTLIEKQSRRRSAATGRESRIPLDAETERCVLAAGYKLDDVLPEGEILQVRKTANLHTGGTIHDVTEQLHPALRKAAVQAALALDIPVVGLDFLVPDVAGADYVIIEANERPGLANHEPQPTAQRFIDLLFPNTRGPGIH